MVHRCDTGGVDQHVDPAMGAADAAAHRLHRRLVGHVQHMMVIGVMIDAGITARAAMNDVARAQKMQGRAATDALAGTGDQHDPRWRGRAGCGYGRHGVSLCHRPSRPTQGRMPHSAAQNVLIG